MCAPEKTYQDNELPEGFDTIAWARALRHESTVRFQPRPPFPFVRAETPRRDHGLPRTNGTVFVVDDHPDLAEFAKTVLDHAGFPTSIFLDGITAWHAFAFAKTQPGLLVVYDSAANLSGRELIRLCRTINPGLKVILVRDDSSESAGLSPGFADVALARSYGGAHLLLEVRRLFGLGPGDAADL